ncbi:MAG: MltA domain-containing protein [Rhizobiales bacterium]|nr:MltA domain-containing protein [Hyphomicrobiales bacterium]
MLPRATPTGGWWRPKRPDAASLAFLACGLLAAMTGSAAARFPEWAGPMPADTIVEPTRLDSIPAWVSDDHRAAFSAFLVTCSSIANGDAAQREARRAPPALAAACRAALTLEAEGPPEAIACRRFFERHFEAFEIRPKGGNGFLTAYYEPEVMASREKSADFPVPVLARPDDLVTFGQNEPRPDGFDANLAAARRTASGFEPYVDRAAIWAGALNERARPIAWLKDEAELFIIQVQGSARLIFADATRARLTYAGRNGHAYTSIGRILVENGEIPLAEMSLERLMSWLRVDRARGRSLMERNRSYVFFALEPMIDPVRGPVGGAGVPLTTGRSLAVDRTIWPYGLPVWISASPLTPTGPRVPLDRLMIAQDTGSAIVGPARGDFFMGSGMQAGTRAGLVRDSMRFIVLLPRGE